MPGPSQQVGALLDAYDRAQFDLVAPALDSLSDLGAFRASLETAALERARGELRTEEDLPFVRRVRLVAASLAIEAAQRRGGESARDAIALVEAFCTLLRLNPGPDAAEQSWFRASIALFAGLPFPGELLVHVEHARRRFPDDGRFLLARAVATEQDTFPDARGSQTFAEIEPARFDLLVTRLRDARKRPEAAAEANLRLGVSYVRAERARDALEYLDAIDLATVPSRLRYLAQLFRGRAHELDHRDEDAAAAYRAALEAEPAAQTAAVALAAVLARTGRRDEANRVMSTTLRVAGDALGQAAARDPWLAYGQADLIEWPALLAAVRRHVTEGASKAPAAADDGVPAEDDGVVAEDDGVRTADDVVTAADERIPAAAPVARASSLEPPATLSQQTFRAQAEATSVPVTVVDGRRPVTGLTASDFELWDNGVRQTIAAVTAGTVPIDVTLVFDASGSMSGDQRVRFQRDVEALVTHLRPVDRLRVLTFATTVSELVPMSPVEPGRRVAVPGSGGASAFFHAVVTALLPASEPGRPHLIVALSDGHDNVSLVGPRDARALAERSTGVLQIVVRDTPRRRTAGWLPFVGPNDPGEIARIAEATGGRLTRVQPEAGAGSLLQRAVDEFRTSYILWFRPVGVDPGGWHELRVRVPAGRYRVTARRGYNGG
jgi:Mg-chelatase subunit ChlD